MPNYDYDLITIGGGSGGVRTSRFAAQRHSKKVAVIENLRIGGTCVMRGCVPKKLLVYAAHFAHDFEDAEGYGWDTGENSHNNDEVLPERISVHNSAISLSIVFSIVKSNG